MKLIQCKENELSASPYEGTGLHLIGTRVGGGTVVLPMQIR